MQTLVTAYGAAYLDAAIPGYPRDIGNEQFGVYVSGPAPLWERHRELLTSLGGANVHTGEDIGDAALIEMLIFAFYMPAMAAFLEAAALATANGRSIHDLVNDTVPLIDMLKREFALIADSFAVGDFETNQAHIDIFAGSSRLALEAVQGVHQHGAVTRAALDVFGRAADSGLGRLKPAAVIRHLIAPQSQALPRAGRSDSLLSPE
jgi:3-hydroxyisobutyrate dehydrogenase-like beta-hydroxyacid dehydrogenase